MHMISVYLMFNSVVCYAEKKLLVEILGNVDEATRYLPLKYPEILWIPDLIPE